MSEEEKSATDKAQRKERKGKRISAKGVFHRVYNAILGKAHAGEDVEVLKVMLTDLEAAFAKFQEKSDSYGELLDSVDEDEKGTLKGINDDLKDLYNELCIARASILKQEK